MYESIKDEKSFKKDNSHKHINNRNTEQKSVANPKVNCTKSEEGIRPSIKSMNEEASLLAC